MALLETVTDRAQVYRMETGPRKIVGVPRLTTPYPNAETESAVKALTSNVLTLDSAISSMTNDSKERPSDVTTFAQTRRSALRGELAAVSAAVAKDRSIAEAARAELLSPPRVGGDLAAEDREIRAAVAALPSDKVLDALAHPRVLEAVARHPLPTDPTGQLARSLYANAAEMAHGDELAFIDAHLDAVTWAEACVGVAAQLLAH